MAQKSISSFFSVKPKSKENVPSSTPSPSESVTSKNELAKKPVVEPDADSSKENLESVANGGNSPAPATTSASNNVPKALAFDPKKRPEPRPTAKRPNKRKSESTAESLQKESTDCSADKRAKVETAVVKDEQDETETKPTIKADSDEEDSPIKKTSKRTSNKSRIISDSEESNDDEPSSKEEDKKKSAEASPKKEAKPVASIFSGTASQKTKSSPVKKSPKSDSKSPKSATTKKGSDKKTSSKESPKSDSKSPKSTATKKGSGKKASPKKSPKPAIIESPKESKESKEKSTPESGKPAVSTPAASAKPKNPFAGFFSPKLGGNKTASGDGKSSDGADYSAKVRKTTYHPIDDCFWKRGDNTPFLGLANTLLAIEETSGRLKTIEILANYFRSVMVQSPDDLLPSVYLTLNRLAPAWEGLELNLGETILTKAIANTTGRTPAQVKADISKLGDLGKVAESSKGSQRTMFQPAILTVPTVFGKLKEVAMMTGHSSGQKKADKIQSLLVACRGSEARYLIRFLAGKLRIGLAEQSVLQALAHACVQTPLLQSDYPPATLIAFKSSDSEQFKEKLAKQALLLKTAYCECPTYDRLIPAMLEVGIDDLHSRCNLAPGIPLKPMLAHPTKGVQEVLTRFENCKFTCEWKYDGERAQIHLDNGTINIYSRNQEDNTSKYPDIIARFPNCKKDDVVSAVLDCEAVAWDREKKTIQPFQILSTRKRKDAVESEIKVQVCLFAFDLLYLNGESLVKKPFQERRDLLTSHFNVVEGEFNFAKSVDGNTTEEIQEALEESIRDNCEGLMVKTLDVEATYEIARRSRNWLKLKKDYLDGVGDTIDLVVIGGYLGKGKRTGVYGGFLLACYDSANEEYQSICKIGTGFSDEDLQKHAEHFKSHVIDKPKSYYSFDSGLAPDHWFDAVQVWEIKCADLSISPVHKAAQGIVDPSKGVSLRFPRFIRIRDDKSPEDATNAEQIADMYRNQDVIKNQNKTTGGGEDDFDF